jgi:hypothetical protein
MATPAPEPRHRVLAADPLAADHEPDDAAIEATLGAL